MINLKKMLTPSYLIQAFEAEVAAHSNAIVVLDNTGMEMINQDHFQKVAIKERLDELHRLWELLLSKLAEKGMRLQQALGAYYEGEVFV